MLRWEGRMYIIISTVWSQKKTAQPKSETNEPITRKINTINRKQTPPVQSSTQIHMDLWWQPPILTSKPSSAFNPRFSSILNAPWYINNHTIHEDLQMKTVYSEIKKWNTKYLRKLENHTNALAVNLLDNSEKIHRPNSTRQTWVKSQYKK
jgi:hypothetical protein